MFEQALMSTTRNKPWTLGASITLQSAIVGTLVLYSALHVDTLTLNPHLEVPLPPAPKLDFVKIIDTMIEHRTGTLSLMPKPFTMPTKIPDGVPEIHDVASDAPSLPFTTASLGSRIGTGVIGGLVTDSVPIAPPKPPVTHEQPAAKRDGPLRLGGQVLDAKILKRVMP